MNKLHKSLIAISLISFIYIVCYCCIYTSVVTFELTKNYDAEYRCVDMIGIDHFHVYVHVAGHDLFLNPFREYGDTYRTYHTTEEFKKALDQHGKFYIPVFDIFVRVY